jgi:uncharacterized damage-inducible protein DinB
LNDQQLREMKNEAAVSERSLGEVAAETLSRLDRALAQVRTTAAEILIEPREVGRAGLPSTVIGLLVHVAEHTTRHVGQAITTASILRGLGEKAE